MNNFLSDFYRLSGLLIESKNIIHKISFYDMDGSLINSPEPEMGKELYKQKTGNEWPYVGWWGN